MTAHLLPNNASVFERALSEAVDVLPRIESAMAAAPGIKLRAPPDDFLPYLHAEYGLGEISRFFDDPRELISQGLAWQRVRGSHAAINQALGWIDYSTAVEIFPARRRRWNLFMLALNELRVNEEPDLNDINELADLSSPVRSRFWRGFKTYDVRGIDYGYTKWGDNHWSSYSGARIREDGAKWSFGRTYELDYTFTQTDLEALGVWIEAGETQPSWGAFTWADSGITWENLSASSRTQVMLSGILAKPAWIVLYDAADQVIGYRRARIFRGVAPATSGVYNVEGSSFTPAASASMAYLEAMTDFGDGDGSTVAKWALSFDNAVVDTEKPGRAWNTAAQVTNGVPIAPIVQSIELGKTVRERFKILLRVS